MVHGFNGCGHLPGFEKQKHDSRLPSSSVSYAGTRRIGQLICAVCISATIVGICRRCNMTKSRLQGFGQRYTCSVFAYKTVECPVLRTGNQRARLAAPCAACKTLRQRCREACVLAPYFPPNDRCKFITAHKVFGATAIIKTIQNLPTEHRADAVETMVYEAAARLRDPVYGCAGTICQLQKQVSDLQSQLAIAQAELVSMQSRQAQLVASISEFDSSSVDTNPFFTVDNNELNNCLVEDVDLQQWEPL